MTLLQARPSTTHLALAICFIHVLIASSAPQAQAQTLVTTRGALTGSRTSDFPPRTTVTLPQTDPRLEVYVYDYAGVPVRAREAAEDEATYLLRKAGVEAEWLVCADVFGLADIQDGCRRRSHLDHISIRIVAGQAKTPIPLSVLGFAPLSPGVQGEYGTILYDRAVRASGSLQKDLPVVLGCVFTHEIGHLLLGPQSHSLAGIMQAKWSEEDLLRANQRRLCFTQEESRQLRAAVKLRDYAGMR